MIEEQYKIHPSTYQWSVRFFSRLRKLLGLNIYLHNEQNLAAEGDIYLFNHFARFETFIPQYLIYLKTGAYCRSVASASFFTSDYALAAYLKRLGAVPNDHPDLIPFLAREILRGNKIVMFPEDGMVKDRSVIDANGCYSIYSRHADDRRKHHTGAALLALSLESFKTRIRLADKKKETRLLDNWSEDIGLPDRQQLIIAANKPTTIIPANITFYPLRIDDNFLPRSINLFSRKRLSRRATEELIIESNLLMRDTDMDIRFCAPIELQPNKSWKDYLILNPISRRLTGIEDYLHLSNVNHPIIYRIADYAKRDRICDLRDRYMQEMYTGVTVNISHLAALALLQLAADGKHQIDEKEFFSILYLCLKRVQANSWLHCHRSLLNPDYYEQILQGRTAGLALFLKNATSSGLIKRQQGKLVLSEQLQQEHDFDQIRLRNVIAVYANEAAPLDTINQIVRTAIRWIGFYKTEKWGALLFDDEMRRYQWSLKQYNQPQHQKINQMKTATETGEPYLMQAKHPNGMGVVLTHGLLASPAELKSFAQQLVELGYNVVGVRLDGHGTTPWDLKHRSWTEWPATVLRNTEIIKHYCSRYCLLGFSAGGLVAMMAAVENPGGLCGLISAATPIKFNDRNMAFVPLVYHINKLSSMVSPNAAVKPFIENHSNHPEINYRHIPLAALYELRLMVSAVRRQIKQIEIPMLILQADADVVVDASSADFIESHLGSSEVERIDIPTDRHGLILENLGNSRQYIVDWIERIRKATADQPALLR